jgi:hypothetical protein
VNRLTALVKLQHQFLPSFQIKGISMRCFINMTVLLAATTIIGCSNAPVETTTAVAKVINKNCPVMGGAVTADGGTVEWKNQTIGFCCPDCVEQFEALSDEEKTAALAKAESGHDDHEHADGEDHDDHGDHQHDGEAPEDS